MYVKKACMHFLSDLVSSISGMFGLTVKEFVAKLFSGFNYFDKIVIIIGVFCSVNRILGDMLIDSIEEN